MIQTLSYLKNILLKIYIIMLGGTIFLSTNFFIDKNILPKWYCLVVCTLLGAIFLVIKLINKSNKIYQLNGLYSCVILFIIYLLSCSLHSKLTIHITYILSFMLLIHVFISIDKKYSTLLNSGFIIIGLLQACYGLLQYLYTLDISSVIVGSFDNTAGFSSCLSVLFPLCLLPNKFFVRFNYLLVGILSFFALIILLSQSRVGILSIGSITLIFSSYKYKIHLKNIKKELIFSALILLLALLIILIFYKKDSSLGRLFIWRTTFNMISDNIIMGSGKGLFISKYMIYQANYLNNDFNSLFSSLADNVTHPFNEYLLLLTEYGLIGLILFITTFMILLKYINAEVLPYALSIIAIMIFALFSYPLRYPFSIVLMAYSLAQIMKSNNKLFSFKIRLNLFFPLLLLIIYIISCSYLLIEDIKFEYKWNKVYKSFLQNGADDDIKNEYKRLYRYWNGNPFFLYNYGAYLNNRAYYLESIDVINKCTMYLNNYDIQLLLADNYLKLDMLFFAEKHYKIAYAMCPNRFIPLYYLMHIYTLTNRFDQATTIAKNIVDKPVKVSSPIINKIKNEAKRKIGPSIPNS